MCQGVGAVLPSRPRTNNGAPRSNTWASTSRSASTTMRPSFLDRSFAASDDAGLSTHIKRVYFDALRTNIDALAAFRVRTGTDGLRRSVGCTNRATAA